MNNKTGYLGNQNLKQASETVAYSEENILEYAKCMKDPIYFIQKYVKIISLDDGLVPFNLFEYQIRFIRILHENRRVIGVCPRQHGKTVCVAAYLCWYIIFNEDKTVAILANKAAAAREIMSRLQLMYENLPKWMQHGIKEWNKGSIKLANNTTAFTAATSSSGIRGKSVNYLYIDEAAIIPSTVAEEFFTATYPTISSGQTTKIALTSTPLGMNFFYKFWTEAEQGINGFVPFRVSYDEHPKHDEKWADQQRQLLGDLKFSQEISCQFLGSSDSLLSGEALGKLASKQPTHLLPNNTLKQYAEPVKNHSYVTCVDTARGKGLDYSTFHVIDISTLPYQVVCTYRDNNISTLVFPEVIYRICELYNRSFVLIETNDLGQQVADILFYDLEYENVYMSSQDNIKEGGDSKYSPGLRTTKKTKAVGCDMLKNLIENDRLEVNDSDTISEFTTFIRVGTTYKAEEGKHDDLVMALVMFAYLTTQPVFKDLFDYSLREQFFAAQLQEIENQMLPLGFVDRGEPAVDVGQYTGSGWVVGNDDDFVW